MPVSASETIVQCKNYHLFRRELYSLRPETWLDDNVLSTISDAMTLVKRKMEDSVNRYLPIVFVVGSKIIFVQLTSPLHEKTQFPYTDVLYRRMQMIHLSVFLSRKSTGSRKTTCQIFCAVKR